MRKFSLRQLQKDLKKITKRISHFGTRKKVVKKVVKKDNKKFNWKKAGMYTLGALGTLGGLYAASKYTKKGKDLTNKVTGVVGKHITGTESHKKHMERKNNNKIDDIYVSIKETREKLKDNLKPEERKRLEKLLQEQEHMKVHKENLPPSEIYDLSSLEENSSSFGTRKKKKVVKKKFNWKKAGLYTLGTLGTVGGLYAASTYNKNVKKEKKSKFNLPFTPMGEKEKQLILEINEIENKLKGNLPDEINLNLKNTLEEKQRKLTELKKSF
jgi:hypothetical protein